MSLRVVLDEVGRGAFSPLLLLAGLITLAPVVGDIPGVPTLMSLFVFLTAGQLLLGRRSVWLPQWLLRRSVNKQRLRKGVRWLRRPAGARRSGSSATPSGAHRRSGNQRPRCHLHGDCAGTADLRAGPVQCQRLGAALTAFGLALLSRDGLMALAGIAFFGITLALVLL